MNEIIYGALAILYKLENGDYKFLLLKHIKGYWTFPGGSKEEADRTLEETLARELKEKIGLDISHKVLVNTNLINRFIYGSEKPERAGKRGETHFYLLKLTGTETFSSWDKIAEHGWFTKTQISNLLPYEDERKIFLKATELLELAPQ